MERFLRVYRKSVREFHDAFTGPDGTRHDGVGSDEILAIVARYVGQPVEAARLSIAYYDPETRLDVADVLHQIAWHKAQGMLKGSIDEEALIDKRYVRPLPNRSSTER